MTADLPSGVESFAIAVPDETIADLRGRLARTRWTDAEGGAGWEQGTARVYLKDLVA